MNSVRFNAPVWMIALFVTGIGLLLSSATLLHSQTWTGLYGPPKARDVRDISIDLNGTTIYVCDKSVLFRSTNGGTSWAATSTEIPSPLAVVTKPSTPNTVVTGVLSYVRRSTNGGTSFDEISIGAGSEPLHLSVSPLNQDRMYLGRKALAGSSSILRSADGGSTWSPPTTYPSGTHVNEVEPSASSSYSQHVWAVGADPSGAAEGTLLSTRGVWRSVDLGVNWTLKGRTENNLRSVAFKASGPLVFVGTESTGKIFVSSDEGDSWSSPISIGGGADSIRALAIRNSSELWAATDAGIFKSTNNGTAWTNKGPSGDNSILSFVITPNNQNILYATTAKTVWKSTNGGDNWTEVTAGLGRMPVSSVAVEDNSPVSKVWTTSDVYDSNGYFDGFGQWATTEDLGFYGQHVLEEPTGRYLSGSINPNRGALKSWDGGSTYTLLYQTPQVTGNIFLGTMIDPQDASKLYLWGKDGMYNFYRIPNYGFGTPDPFIIGGSTYTVNDVAAHASGGPYYFGLNGNGGVWKCESGPCTGTQTSLNNMTVRSIAVTPGVQNIVYAAGTGGVYHSTNAGSTWLIRNGASSRRVITSPGYTSNARNVLVLTADGMKILHSTASGAGWTEVQGNLPKPIKDLAAVPGNPAVVYAATDQGAFRIFGISTAPTLASPANGATVGAVPTLSWNSVSGATAYNLQVSTNAGFTTLVYDQVLTVTSAAPTNLTPGNTYYWRAGAGNFVGETVSASRSFTVQASPWIALTKSSYVGGDNKIHPRLNWTHDGQGTSPIFYIYRYSCPNPPGTDCGTWPYPFMAATTATTYDDPSADVAQKGQTPDVTYYYEVRSAGISNKVSYNGVTGPTKELVVDPLLPKVTALHQNYPNPFNPTTTVKYDLAFDSRVRIVLYDLLGQEIATLVDEEQTAGFKEFIFDGNTLPSGVYFFRMTAGEFMRVRKMALVR